MTSKPLPGDDRRIADSLRWLERSAEVPDAARQRVHDRVMNSLAASTQSPDTHAEVEVIELTTARQNRRLSAARRLALGVAAVVLVVAAIAVAGLNRPESDDVVTGQRIGGTVLPVEVPAGVHTSDALGETVTFELTRPMTLLREDDAMVELAPDRSTDGRLLFVRPPEPLDPLALLTDPRFNVQTDRATIDGVTYDSWAVFGRSGACVEAAASCREVLRDPSVVLPTGSQMRIVDITQRTSEPLYIVVMSDPGEIALDGATSILQSIRLGEGAAD